jgi:exopolysaccharide production protein ExoZ
MKERLNLLQVYRGIAALLVVASHGSMMFQEGTHQPSFLNLFTWGWVGVDFFFVLSGFIIFYIHRSDIGFTNKFTPFILKRFIRVYPLYWVVLLCKVLMSLLSSHGIALYEPIEFIKAFLLLPQDRTILETNFIGVSWTLKHEIFFYFLFSLLILKPKLSVPIILVWISGVFLSLVGLFKISEANLLAQFIFNERNLEFIFGCLAAYIVYRHKISYGKFLCGASVGLLAVAIANTRNLEFTVAGISPVIAYGIPLLLLIIGSVSLERQETLSVPKPLIFLGNASYSIYLTHGFFMSNLIKVFTQVVSKFGLEGVFSNSISSSAIAGILFILTVGCGIVIHISVENPLIAVLRKRVFSKSN